MALADRGLESTHRVSGNHTALAAVAAVESMGHMPARFEDEVAVAPCPAADRCSAGADRTAAAAGNIQTSCTDLRSETNVVYRNVLGRKMQNSPFGSTWPVEREPSISHVTKHDRVHCHLWSITFLRVSLAVLCFCFS